MIKKWGRSVTPSIMHIHYVKMHEWDSLCSIPEPRKFYLSDSVLCGIHCSKMTDLIDVPLHNQTNQTELHTKKRCIPQFSYRHHVNVDFMVLNSGFSHIPRTAECLKQFRRRHCRLPSITELKIQLHSVLAALLLRAYTVR